MSRGGFPRNFQDLQRALQSAQRSGGGFGGGSGGSGGGRGIAGLAVLALGGGWAVSNSLYNGKSLYGIICVFSD
jgi:hypothetical protein